MIERLKHKFVFMAMSLFIIFLVFMVTGMNLINYSFVINDANISMEIISENDGNYPLTPPPGKPADFPELPYQVRYFYVVLSDSGRIIEANTSRIAAVDKASAAQYALEVLMSGEKEGWIGDYRYSHVDEGRTSRITFVDCSRKLHSFKVFLQGSIIISFFGIGIVYIIMMFFAERFVRPVADSYDKQKRFISDASHEIKTPLTIINANIELLEMDLGENECLSDIHQQTQRLTTLTEDLVSLARLEEGEIIMDLKNTLLSELLANTLQSFKAVAQSQNKDIQADIQPMLSAKLSPSAIERLIFLIMDNAVKYSPEGETIRVSLSKQGKNLRMDVYNRCLAPISREELGLLFDRFYRSDSVRYSSGGHGIGLSVASAIVEAHNGKIFASTEDEKSVVISVILPV